MQEFSLRTKKMRQAKGEQLIPQTALFKFMNDLLLRVAGLTANERRGKCQLHCGSTNRHTAPSWLFTRLHYKQMIPPLQQHPSRQEVGLYDPFHLVIHTLMMQYKNILL